MKEKIDVQIGDIIHIYAMFGEPHYKGREGVVTYIDSMHQIHGTWGGLALQYSDDWEIIDEKKIEKNFP